MIGYVKGKLLHYEDNVVILDVNGVGYEITCSASLYARLIENEGGEAFTYLALREDGMYLYGFDTMAEKKMFLQLITVSGVGPKMGIAILSGTSLNDLAIFIASSDVKSLSKIKGLGKKTAERIIVELREAMQKVSCPSVTPIEKIVVSGEGENAVLALMSLGYSKADASDAVSRSVADGNKTLNDLITGALKYFAR